MLIGITGKIGSGKSTLATFLQEKYGYTEDSMANPLKKIGSIFRFTDRQLYGTQEEKLEVHPYWKISSRTFLQKVGTQIFRDILPTVIPEMHIENTVWIDLFKMRYSEGPKTVVISDVRFLDEEKAIRELGGIIIRTIRTNKVSSPSQEEHRHVSETEMEQIKADITVDNDAMNIEESLGYVARELATYMV